MDVTIIGTGNNGKALTARAVAGGHRVTLFGTSPEEARGVAEEVSADVRPGTVGDPIAGDVVVQAVWYRAVADVLAPYGDQLDGKVRDRGLRPIDAGPLARTHELEALGFLHMALQGPLGTGFASTVKVLS